MASKYGCCLVLVIAMQLAHCAPQIKIEKKSKETTFVEKHNNLLDWLNFFDDYTATSTTEAPVLETSPLEFIFGPTPNSEGTRSGQTLGNPLPTFIQSSSDSKESRGEQTSKNPMPTFIESTSSGDSKGPNEGQTFLNPMPTFIVSKPTDDSRRDGQSPSGNPTPTFIGSKPATDSRRDDRNPSDSPTRGPNGENRFRQGGQSPHRPMQHNRNQYSRYNPMMSYRAPLYQPSQYRQYRRNSLPFWPMMQFKPTIGFLTNFGQEQSPVSQSQAIHSLSRDCSGEELKKLVGQEIENLPKMSNLPGFRCYKEDFSQPGRCIESSCVQARFCGARGHQIKGKCKGFQEKYDKLCCMA